MTLVDRARLAARLVALLAIPGIALAPGDARAQSAEAEVLFREGRKLLKAGRLEAGCDKLEASERLESSLGTLLNLGDCREKLGRHASAWAAFRKAEAVAKRSGNEAKRQAEAGRRAAALEPRLSNMVIQVTAPVDGLVVRREDEVVDPAVWNTAVPLDPDTYTIVAEAPGYKPWRAEVPIGGKLRRQVVTVPKLERLPVAVKPPEPPAPVAVAPSPMASSPLSAPLGARVEEPIVIRRARPGMWTPARKISAGLAVVGAASLGGGIYYGLRSRDQQADSNELCPQTLCDNASGLRLNDQAQTSATRANILYAVGGTAMAASILIWVLGAPEDETVVTPTVGAGRVGVSFGGKF
ncbi:MAG: tetratricopeptide repeat protein [Deltaproteobacteria bacterium]|nr:tetratricopeptide repeat protein [Deltaproteobacteria bacterium]MDQ3299208.1 tetratricopeptide repeat protein [Myxococcota bacterium]